MATLQNVLLTKVEHDVGTNWFTVFIDDPTVKKVTTKMEQKAQEAAGFVKSGQRVDLEYSARSRHDEASGRTYNNNYYERAKPAANGASASTDDDDGIEKVGETSRKTAPEDARRMARSTAGYLTLQTLPLMEQKDPETQLRIADFWERYIMGELSYRDFASSSVPSSAHGAYAEPLAPAPSPDDDIPF